MVYLIIMVDEHGKIVEDRVSAEQLAAEIRTIQMIGGKKIINILLIP